MMSCPRASIFAMIHSPGSPDHGTECCSQYARNRRPSGCISTRAVGGFVFGTSHIAVPLALPQPRGLPPRRESLPRCEGAECFVPPRDPCEIESVRFVVVHPV